MFEDYTIYLRRKSIWNSERQSYVSFYLHISGYSKKLDATSELGLLKFSSQ